jgi:hypothetical protein
MVAFAHGCIGQEPSRKHDSSSKTDLKSTEVDLGIVIKGQEGYYCLPLSSLGHVTPESISKIETSCDCLTARIIQYRNVTGDNEPGLLVTYSDKDYSLSKSEGKMEKAINLKVSVLLITQDGLKTEVLFSFLNTSHIDNS